MDTERLSWKDLTKEEKEEVCCAAGLFKEDPSWEEIFDLFDEDDQISQISQIILDERENRMDELKLGESICHAGLSWKKIYCQAGYGYICDYENSLTDYDERENCSIIDDYAFEYVFPDESGSWIICAYCLPGVTKVDIKKMLDIYGGSL